MKNLFNNTDLNVFYVIHKLIEHPKVNFAEIDSRVVKAYAWFMYQTNVREAIIHDLTDKGLANAVGVSEDYIHSKLRPALAELGLVGSVRNQRGKGWKYFVLDPDTGQLIDPSPFDAAKLTANQIREYYRVSLENLGMVVNTQDTVRNGKRLLIAQCPICRRGRGKPHFEVKLEEEGHWMCFDCQRYGDMLMFEQEFHEQLKGRKLFKNQAAVKLARFLKRLEKSSAAAVPISDAEVQAAFEVA